MALDYKVTQGFSSQPVQYKAGSGIILTPIPNEGLTEISTQYGGGAFAQTGQNLADLEDPQEAPFFYLAGETSDAELHSGADLILYSDVGETEVARIDGETGDITTEGTVDTIDVASHAHTGEAGQGAQVDAAAVTYTPAVATDWDSDTDPGDANDAFDQLAERVDDIENAGYLTSVDAADVTYTPGVLTDWDSDADPGDTNDALDQLAERVDDVENAGYLTSVDAGDVTYTPAVATDWDSDADPGDLDDALDQLAERVDDIENAGYLTSVDAGDVTYTPNVLTDWDGDADPGDVDNALDQLAERVDDLEGGAGHAAVTLAADADVLLSLSTQEIGLDTQTANTVFAGPITGEAADPTFRALVAADVPDISATYAVAAKGVTNGDTHDHAGGDGAQIDHGGLAGLSDADHVAASVGFTATDKLLGRSTAGAGAGEEIACTPAGRALIGKTAFPGFSVNKDGTNQSIPSATWTKLTWNTEEWDTNNNFADNKFTPGITGRYYLSITGLFDQVPIGKRIALAVYKNGALLKYGMLGDGAVETSLSTHMACIVEANGTTDYFEAFAYHDAAAALDCNGAISATYFQGHFLPTG